MAFGEAVMIVEDDCSDASEIAGALRESGFSGPLLCCRSAEEALRLLREQAGGDGVETVPLPRLILLDWRLPGRTGLELLEEIKAEDALAAIPVIVFSGTTDVEAVQACYRAGAAAFVQKPEELGRFVRTVGQIGRYWGGVATLPGSGIGGH